MDEDDIGDATSPVTGLIRRLHRHHTGRAAPASTHQTPRDQTTAIDLADPLHHPFPFRTTASIPGPGPPVLARKAH